MRPLRHDSRQLFQESQIFQNMDSMQLRTALQPATSWNQLHYKGSVLDIDMKKFICHSSASHSLSAESVFSTRIYMTSTKIFHTVPYKGFSAVRPCAQTFVHHHPSFRRVQEGTTLPLSTTFEPISGQDETFNETFIRSSRSCWLLSGPSS